MVPPVSILEPWPAPLAVIAVVVAFCVGMLTGGSVIAVTVDRAVSDEVDRILRERRDH